MMGMPYPEMDMGTQQPMMGMQEPTIEMQRPAEEMEQPSGITVDAGSVKIKKVDISEIED